MRKLSFIFGILVLLGATSQALENESDLDFEVEKREFTDEELQDFEIEDHSDLDYVQAEDLNLNFQPGELPQYADREGARPQKQRKGLFNSIFKKSFEEPASDEGSPLTPVPALPQASTPKAVVEQDASLLKGYFPANPLRETYQGSKLLVEVYKAPGNGLPEFVAARIDGILVYAALASTARAGKSTPSGTYPGVHYRSMRHRSSLYHNSPMPYAQFFNGNIAFHGVLEDYYPYLGGKASAGCVRLQVDDGLRLWRMAAAVGMNVVTKVHVAGTQPPAWELKQIQVRLKENTKQRDFYITNFQRRGHRSPYWPTGYFSGHGINP